MRHKNIEFEILEPLIFTNLIDKLEAGSHGFI